ncbi:MAG: dihydrodipicolinate synthase family protein [Bacteroidetes bacterium]|nr:MAG: dihydrodipicolinate synthase family protein [Bacteroidota bacterium]
MSARWKGVFPAVTTKFKDDFSIDYKAMERHIDGQIQAGVHGIVTTGTLGENASLSAKEKQEVLKIAVSVSAGRVPVLAGVAENTTAGACEVVTDATANGADGFMLLPAMMYPADRRETLEHFRTVGRMSELPIMIYNNPVVYKVDVTPEMFGELAEIESFVALKESSDDPRRITDIYNEVGDRYQIFTGVDNLALESLMLGAVGWVAGLVVAFPRETVAIYDLARAGRYAEALVIYRWFMPMLHLDVSTKLVQNIKLAEVLAGVGTETVRPPRLSLVGEERAHVIRVVESALANRPALPELSGQLS